VLHAHCDLEPVSEALAKLTNVSRYSLLELQERSVPEGIDAQKLEAYLKDEEFEV